MVVLPRCSLRRRRNLDPRYLDDVGVDHDARRVARRGPVVHILQMKPQRLRRVRRRFLDRVARRRAPGDVREEHPESAVAGRLDNRGVRSGSGVRSCYDLVLI